MLPAGSRDSRAKVAAPAWVRAPEAHPAGPSPFPHHPVCHLLKTPVLCRGPCMAESDVHVRFLGANSGAVKSKLSISCHVNLTSTAFPAATAASGACPGCPGHCASGPRGEDWPRGAGKRRAEQGRAGQNGQGLPTMPLSGRSSLFACTPLRSE